MPRRAREADFFTVTRPIPVLSPEEREQWERAAKECGDRGRKIFGDDIELQAWMAANPEAASQAVAEWMDTARLAGLLPPAPSCS